MTRFAKVHPTIIKFNNGCPVICYVYLLLDYFCVIRKSSRKKAEQGWTTALGRSQLWQHFSGAVPRPHRVAALSTVHSVLLRAL